MLLLTSMQIYTNIVFLVLFNIMFFPSLFCAPFFWSALQIQTLPCPLAPHPSVPTLCRLSRISHNLCILKPLEQVLFVIAHCSLVKYFD